MSHTIPTVSVLAIVVIAAQPSLGAAQDSVALASSSATALVETDHRRRIDAPTMPLLEDVQGSQLALNAAAEAILESGGGGFVGDSAWDHLYAAIEIVERGSSHDAHERSDYRVEVRESGALSYLVRFDVEVGVVAEVGTHDAELVVHDGWIIAFRAVPERRFDRAPALDPLPYWLGHNRRNSARLLGLRPIRGDGYQTPAGRRVEHQFAVQIWNALLTRRGALFLDQRQIGTLVDRAVETVVDQGDRWSRDPMHEGWSVALVEFERVVASVSHDPNDLAGERVQTPYVLVRRSDAGVVEIQPIARRPTWLRAIEVQYAD